MEGQSESWLDEHLYKLQEMPYFSQSSLKAALYLPEVPVYDAVPDTMQNPAGVVFGDTVRLAGYDVGEPAGADLALPVALYWQAVAPTDRRYKYALRLVRSQRLACAKLPSICKAQVTETLKPKKMNQWALLLQPKAPWTCFSTRNVFRFLAILFGPLCSVESNHIADNSRSHFGGLWACQPKSDR